MSIPRLPTPLASNVNISYQVSFTAPAVKCDEANATQQKYFNNYVNFSQNYLELLSQDKVEDVESPSLQVVYSGFDPRVREHHMVSTTGYSNQVVVPPDLGFDDDIVWYDKVCNCSARPSDCPEGWCDIISEPPYTASYIPDALYFRYPQLWIQTSNRSLVCIGWNATYNIGVNISNGAQDITIYNKTILNPVVDTYMDKSNDTEPLRVGYSVAFASLWNMLLGNVSTSDAGQLLSTSQMISTTLGSCDEMVNTWWLQEWGLAKDILPTDTGACRNKTLDRAIEDLASNFSIGLLGEPVLNEQMLRPAKIAQNHLVYSYDARNLLISYCVGLFLTLLALLLGVRALLNNGVSYNTSFSTIVNTTRDGSLDVLARVIRLAHSRSPEQRADKSFRTDWSMRGWTVNECHFA